MSQEEMIEQLRAENVQLKEEKARESAEKAQILAENRQLRELVEELSKRLHEKIQEAAEQAEAEKQRQQEQIEALSEQVHELEGRVAKNSSNSSKPPSTDGYAKKKRSLRQPSGKKPGGQAGHPGSTRSFVETPDEVIIVRPEKCPHCQASLQGVEASGYERRQKVDLPQIKARVTEYQAQDVRCPSCQQVTRGTFPDEVRASIQFGPMVKGIALYLLSGQLLPYARTAELLTDLCGCPLSPGTLETFVAQAADRLVEGSSRPYKRQRSRERMRRVFGSKDWCTGCMWFGPTISLITPFIGNAARLPPMPSVSSLTFTGRWSMTVTTAILSILSVSMPSAMLILFESCVIEKGQGNF